jgi:hypothetical protein
MGDMYDEMYDYPDEYYEEQIHRERLRLRFEDPQDPSRKARESLIEAKLLKKSGFPNSAFICGAISCEVFLKDAILIPVFAGLVNSEILADGIAELAVMGKNMPNVLKAVRRILADVVDLDWSQFNFPIRPGDSSQKGFRGSLEAVRKLRNDLVHDWKQVSEEEAQYAIEVAEVLLEQVYPSMAARLLVDS